jgi:hypothetical protein
VLDPFAANIRALEAPSTLKSGIPKLLDTFNVTEAPVDGVSVPYAGWVSQMNSGVCAPTVAQALAPYPQFCSVLQGLNEGHGNSIYHSFQLKAEKRYRNGLYMLVSYTNSKIISDASDNTQQLGGSWNATQGVISPFEKGRARSLSSDDVPQIISAAFVYDLPFGKGKRYLAGGMANAVVGGWQISPIIHWNSGTPMWFRDSNSGCAVVSQFRQSCLVGLVPGANPFLQDPNSFNPSKGPLLNAAAFEPASNFLYTDTTGVGGPGQFGYTGSGPRITNLRGPNAKNVDISLTKNTPIGERGNFQLRVGFFNAFNQHYFYNAANVNNQGSSFAFNNDVSAPNFGAWNGGVSSPRTIQIGARLEF